MGIIVTKVVENERKQKWMRSIHSHAPNAQDHEGHHVVENEDVIKKILKHLGCGILKPARRTRARL